MNYFRENNYYLRKQSYFSFQIKRIHTITNFALSSILLFVSLLSFSQEPPPTVDAPTPENARLIDTLIQVTAFDEHFRAYCMKRIAERAQQQKWSAATIKKMTNDVDFKYFTFTIHNAFSTYNTKHLENLIVKYRLDQQSARSKNAIIDNQIVQANLKYFGDNLLNGAYSASVAKSQNHLVTTDYNDTKNMVEVPPEYPGGIKAFLQFIEEEFHPPDTFASSETDDKLLASFVVEKDGSLVDIVILKDLGYSTGEELKRVLKLSKKWKPGMQDGRAVRVAFTIPVRLHLPGIKINEPPIIRFTLNESVATQKALKLAPLILTKQRYLFLEKFNTCMREDYHFESGKQALSDRFSIISQIGEGIAADSLKKLTGRICFEVLIDTLGQTCVLSLQNDLTIPGLASLFKDAVETKTKWKIVPVNGRKNEPVSVILVFIFSNDRMYYRHMGFTATLPNIVELEASEKSKFTAY